MYVYVLQITPYTKKVNVMESEKTPYSFVIGGLWLLQTTALYITQTHLYCLC